MEIRCWLCIVFVCRTEMRVVYSVHESMFDYVSKCVGGKDFLVQICVCVCVSSSSARRCDCKCMIGDCRESGRLN